MVEAKKNNTKNIKFRITIIAGSILFAIVAGVFIGRPVYLNLTNVNLELEESKAKLARMEAKLSALKTLEARKEELEKNNQLLIEALPESRDIPRLFYQIGSIGGLTGIAIDSVGSTETNVATTTITEEGQTATVESKPITLMQYSIKAKTSSYENVKLFLDKTEDALRVLSIEQIDITRGEDGQISLEIKVNTYKRS